MEEKITKEFIDGLLQWGQERLDKGDYPKETIRVNTSHSIPDCRVYIDAMVHTLALHWENPLFRPMVEEFDEFRHLLTDHPAAS